MRVSVSVENRRSMQITLQAYFSHKKQVDEQLKEEDHEMISFQRYSTKYCHVHLL